MFSSFVWSGIALSLRVSTALTILPPPSPVYLGTTVHITWTSSPGDPPSFSLSAQCADTVALPSVNAVTAEGGLFVQLPSFLDFDVSVPCSIIGRTNGANGTVLSQSATFNLVLQSPSNVNSNLPVTQLNIPSSTRMQSTITRSSSTTSRTLTASVTTNLPSSANASTIALSSMIFKTETPDSITVSFSTVTPQISSGSNTSFSGPSSTTSSSAQIETSTSSGNATSPTKKVPVAAIVGASAGGFVVVCALFIGLILYRQRRRESELPMLEPLEYTAIPSSGSGSSRIEVVQTSDNINPSSSTQLLPAEDDQGLHRLVQQMSERIRILEAQQGESREILLGGYEPQAPPDYSDRGRTPLPLSRTVSPSNHPLSHQGIVPGEGQPLAEESEVALG
ncbi:hypothetical protein H0H92_004421 [Tricholoma furcatifolium]|nr:hypothetical protein H0H92_004421 [Tricholoma furcatifolium]